MLDNVIDNLQTNIENDASNSELETLLNDIDFDNLMEIDVESKNILDEIINSINFSIDDIVQWQF